MKTKVTRPYEPGVYTFEPFCKFIADTDNITDVVTFKN